MQCLQHFYFCVCVSVNFFSVKHFSGTTAPRILTKQMTIVVIGSSRVNVHSVDTD